MKYKIAICDDSDADREYVLNMVNRWAAGAGQVVHTDTFTSAENFLFHYAEESDYDILLLDIEMGDMDGVTMAKQLRKNNDIVQIVFITGYSDYISEGYEVAALHYLMKPVKEEKLCSVLDRAAEKLQKNETVLNFEIGGEMLRLPIYQIRYADVFGNYVTIHALSDTTVKMTLGELEKQLDERFYRVGRSAIINLTQISRVTKSEIKLVDGTAIPLPRGAYDGINRAIYVFTCLKAWGGAFDVGSITQYVGAATAMVANVFSLTGLLGTLETNTGYLDKTFEFLDIPNAMYQGSLTTEKRSDRRYEVEFKDVSFKYPGSDIWALRHVNMKFKVGKRLAVVGENGSGKTTFIKLLCRLYDPQEGQILLNGIDIRKYRYDDYINIFSVVFQDFQLISQPLGNNVAGSMNYDRERVRKALLDAGFGDRLATMEKGLDTTLYKGVYEDGVDVSGGEAQKIAIARALYKDAPFIILDEPTAALDPIAEAEIYSKFDEIAGDKTAIYISHRLSSCKFCDEIAVFHEGAVIQQGTHAELVADENGKYYELWNAQAQYYTE